MVHGSQPQFTIPEIVADVNRAVRFIRYHAAGLRDRPRPARRHRRLGGRAPVADARDGRRTRQARRRDPIDASSSRVQAVACFFPPTDFLNYGEPGETAIGEGTLRDFAAPFDFHDVRPVRKQFERITDRAEIERIAREVSPIHHVTADDPQP